MPTYIYGPVPSRRLGRSLGVDLVPFKTYTLEDISNGLGLHRNEVLKYVEELASEGSIVKEVKDGKAYYEAKR